MLFAFCWLAITPALAEVALPAVIDDDMVLQRDMKVPVWGRALPGEKVTVEIANQRKTTTTDNEGKWSVTLDPLDAGGPLEMTVTGENTVTGKSTVRLTNILVGEVWICSGQSNMEWPVSLAADAEAELLRSIYPKIRLFKVKKAVAEAPMSNCAGYWSSCDPMTVAGFSAVAYYFGRELHNNLKIPVGLIDSSWGASMAEAWTRKAVLESNDDLKPILERLDESLATYKTIGAMVESWRDFEDRQVEWGRAVGKAAIEGKELPTAPVAPPCPARQHIPSGLYNGMIAPLIPYAIRGAIWYQGESNAARAYQYRELFPAMINNWRSDWGQGEFPFLFVQIAPFGAGFYGPNDAAELREAQLGTLRSVSNTGMVVTMDIGNVSDIHPRNKQEVGRRLALWALAKTYGDEEIVYAGPLYQSMRVEGDTIRIRFDHVNGGLVAHHGDLKGFAIADNRKDFVPAVAVIDGDTIVVSSSEVTEPVAVRYAWSNAAAGNLFNQEGLPASPFRTDNWPGQTVDKR